MGISLPEAVKNVTHCYLLMQIVGKKIKDVITVGIIGDLPTTCSC